MNTKEAVKNLASRPGGETTDADPGTRDDGDVGTDKEREADVPPLPLDAVFELLKNQRRRYTIDYLRRADGEVTLSDLAEHVAAKENDTSTQALSSDERKRAYVGLYQCHLPKMDEMNAVEFNRDRGIIDIGPNAAQLKPYLDLDEGEQAQTWSRYYLGVSALGFSLLAVSVVVAGPGASVVASLATLLVLTTLAGLHYSSEGTDDE